MNNLHEKLCRLKQELNRLNHVAVAFSGGVDSTFLLNTAHGVLGNRAIAVTARSLSLPKREFDQAIAFCENNGIECIVVDSEELNIEGFSQNPTNRCYLCKTELFSKMNVAARQRGIPYVLDGSNADDVHDYRPGMQAAVEQGVLSPLMQVRLTKNEIRQLSREMGLSTWNKQSFACLASRFPYGDHITPEKLRMVDDAEQLLLDMGFGQVRVRCHGSLARIEIDEGEFGMLLDQQRRWKILERFRQIGFAYVTLDIGGYRTGSMNEVFSVE